MLGYSVREQRKQNQKQILVLLERPWGWGWKGQTHSKQAEQYRQNSERNSARSREGGTAADSGGGLQGRNCQGSKDTRKKQQLSLTVSDIENSTSKGPVAARGWAVRVTDEEPVGLRHLHVCRPGFCVKGGGKPCGCFQ